LIFACASWLDHAMSNAPRQPELSPKERVSSGRSVRPNVANPEAQPFLKWAGGKSQLLAQFEPFFPKLIRNYCEPFLGGGAVFFHLKARFPKMRAMLRDNNKELINCYEVVRDQVEGLMKALDEHRENFRAQGEPYYYQVRGRAAAAGPLERAARMIFLNKTCYNGLYRVNNKGQFNVPIGSYRPDRVSLYDPANLVAASHALHGVDLKVQDFGKTLASVESGDFVYVDPPYYPLSRTANFTSYTQEDFGAAEQERLTALVTEAAKRGARIMLSNSDTPTTRRLYHGFRLETVQARRAVNCDGAKRGRISELVALTYD
jgi:DNA adenine methylase